MIIIRLSFNLFIWNDIPFFRHINIGDIMHNFNQGLLNFLNKGTCVFTAAKEIIQILEDNGYERLKENQNWNFTHNKYYVVRNDASIIAFHLGNELKKQFLVVCTHHDTPSFLIKPNPEYFENGYLKLNVAPYGGILNYGFMDRPLGIAGRVILKSKEKLKSKIIDLEKAVAIIPSVAIHQNDKANSNLDLNTQKDLVPILSLDKNMTLESLIKDSLCISEKIYDFDLYLYNTDDAKIINDSFIASPRIDNLTCTYAALKSFLDSNSPATAVLAIFNSEEIGSNTVDGADSNLLFDTLKKICHLQHFDFTSTLDNSYIISADNTHARHPNHNELSDYTNSPLLNDGVLIMREINGTSNALTSALFKRICEHHSIFCSYYTSRNDFATGSTQAGASLKHLSIHSIDVGLPMLAMHSGLEIIGISDTYALYQALLYTYQTNFTFENHSISFH